MVLANLRTSLFAIAGRFVVGIFFLRVAATATHRYRFTRHKVATYLKVEPNKARRLASTFHNLKVQRGQVALCSFLRLLQSRE